MSAGRVLSPLTMPFGSQWIFSMRLSGCAAADLAQSKTALASSSWSFEWFVDLPQLTAWMPSPSRCWPQTVHLVSSESFLELVFGVAGVDFGYEFVHLF